MHWLFTSVNAWPRGLEGRWCAFHGTVAALCAERTVHGRCQNEPCVGAGPASQLDEHMGCKPLYVFYTDFLPAFFFFWLPFYFLGLKVASGSCRSLRSVNFLLPIKMQIHISMQCVMDLCKPWGFLHSILYWLDFNLDCLSKLCRFLKVQ